MLPTRTRHLAAGCRWASWLAIAFACCITGIALPGNAAIYLKVGTIKGGSFDLAHRDWSDAAATEFGVTRGTDTRGIPVVADLTVEKPGDIATSALLRQMLTGAEGVTVDLEFIRNSAERQRYYRIRLYEALISAFSQTSGGAGEPPVDTISFNYQRIEVTYTVFTGTGSQVGEVSAWYDVIRNEGGASTENNTPPTISAIAATNVLEDASVTIPFTVGDAQTSAGSLSVSASSTNASLLPVSRISFGGSGANRTVTLAPSANLSGTTYVTVTVSDSALTASTAFLLTVSPVNDAPTINSIPTQTTYEDSAVKVDFTIGDPDDALDSLQLSASSSNPALVPDANLVFSGVGVSRSLTITPAPGQTGQGTISIRVSDGTLSVTNSFLLAVNQYVPQAPTDIVLNTNLVPENSPGGTVVGRLTAVDADSTNHTFVLLDSAGGTFQVNGAELRVADGAVLDYEAATNHSVVVKAVDAQGFEFTKSLTIAVLNVNEAPGFVVSDVTLIAAIAGRAVALDRLQVRDPDAGTNGLTLSLEVVNGTISALAGAGVTVVSNATPRVTVTGPLSALNALLLASNGITYAASNGIAGTDVLTATLNDNGNSGSGGPRSVFTTLGIRIYASQFDEWVHTHFTQTEIQNASLEATLWGVHADPDHDGLENIAEYGLGTLPRTHNAGPQARIVSFSGTNRLALQFNRRGDPQLAIAVEVADAVTGGWSSDASQLEILPPGPSVNGFQLVQFNDRMPSSGAQKRFMRLRWTLSPPLVVP